MTSHAAGRRRRDLVLPRHLAALRPLRATRHGAAAAVACRDSSGSPAPLPRYPAAVRFRPRGPPPAMPSRRRIRRRHGQEQQGRGSCACSGGWQQLSVPCKLATAHEEEVSEFLYASTVSTVIAYVAAGKSVALSEQQAGNR
ncbi:unnamed protein product [Urochloa humidicola]